MDETKEFWITNASNRDVSIGDLRFVIKAYSTINLMDKKHYRFTLESVKKSVSSGSIFNKRDKIFVRKVPPTNEIILIPVVEEGFPTRQRSLVDVKYEHYQELDISDEQWAEENADIVELDSKKG